MVRKRNRRTLSFAKVFLILLLLLLVGGGCAAYFLFFEQEAPKITLNNDLQYLGKKGEIRFTATDTGSGLRSLLVVAEQNGVSRDLYSKVFPRTHYLGEIGPKTKSQQIFFDPIKSGFKDGEITISIEAQDFSARNFLAGNKSTISKKVILDTKAPKIRPIYTEEYIWSGGSGIVIYRLDDPESLSGVTVNGRFYQGFPLQDGRKNVFISYFALPYDTESISELFINATDRAGNFSKMIFSTTFKASPKVQDRINISDRFLAKKIPEFEENSSYEMKGDRVSKYIFINNQMRRDNNAAIAKICETTDPNRLWQGRFGRMAGASPAGFAERRSYYYKNRLIDKQVHLGMDLASTKRAHVKASNTGKVAFADYLGIYGNMIMLDHGQGVFSLYSHLSQINVAVGEDVTKGSTIGLTGATGMAGGDHLHFSILVHGTFVNPREWWDSKWIKVNIDDPILDSRI